jgi:mRNA interferase RelE/StbE
VAEVAALASAPRPAGVVKLAGADNLWRLRIGVYRIVYEIRDDRLTILVLRVAHRKDAYREG